jgi:hypothetical protein
VTIEVQFHNSTFLPHNHHLAGSISQPESSTKPKVKIMLEISIKQIMVMLDLLTKSWPYQQLLVALVSLTTANCSIHSKPTMQCLPPSVVMQSQEGTMFGIPSVAHRHKQ